jgi:hypothetical protein
MPAELYDDLMGLAILDEGNLAQQIREGLKRYVAARKAEPNFREQVEAAAARQTTMLSGLTRES